MKELKYIELYNKQYGEIRTQEGQDRRKRAADHALEETRKEARKGPEIEGAESLKNAAKNGFKYEKKRRGKRRLLFLKYTTERASPVF